MSGPWRWTCLGILALLGLANVGCNLMALPYFIFQDDDRTMPPLLKRLAPDDKNKDKELKVAIVAYAGNITKPEFLTADRELSAILGQYLNQSFKEHKEKVTVVSPGQVNKYTDTHPNWNMDLEALGKHLEADYLIYLEIEGLSLYEKGSMNQLFRGRADIQVSLIDMKRPDEYPLKKGYHGEFPKGAPVPVEDRNPQEFQRGFLSFVAKHLAWYFIPHAPHDDIACRE